MNQAKQPGGLRCHDPEACAGGLRACPSPVACGCAAPISADLRRMEHEARNRPQPSPTAGMNLGQRILHVGGRENAAGYIEFGSVAAVRALVGQVLRDLQAAPPAPAAVPVLYVSPEQLAKHLDLEGAENAEAGRYLPARKTPAGKFTQPLYAIAAAPAQEHATQLAGQGIEVVEKLLRLAQIVDRAVEDWGESFADGSCQVKFHKDEADKMEAILEFFDSLPDAPKDESVIESGPLKAARAIRAAAPTQAHTQTAGAPSREEIASLRASYGITSNGRGIKEFEQVASFARDVLARWGCAPAQAHKDEQA